MVEQRYLAPGWFTRNIFKEFFKPDASPALETRMSQWSSLVVKFGALVFIFLVPQKYAIQLQLLGGVWILQTFPAVVVGLYTRWLHRWGLLAGWATGMALGTWLAHELAFKANVYPVTIAGLRIDGYTALWALIANFGVATVVSAVLHAVGVARGEDTTRAEDYGPAAVRAR